MKIACTDDNRYLVDNKSWTDEVVRHGLSYMELAMSKLPENVFGKAQKCLELHSKR